MTSAAFRIFGYSASERDPESIPILVVVHCQGNSTCKVLTLLRSDWKLKVPSSQRRDTRYIEDFIYDLRQMSYETDAVAEDFFAETLDLSIGPVRTVASGNCQIQQLDVFLKLFSGSHPEFAECSEAAFHAVLSPFSRLSAALAET